MLNLISYDRISDDTEGDEHGVDSQARQNDRSAAAHGGRIIARFVDPDVSASDSDIYREGFEGLIKALLLGHLDDGTPIHGMATVEQSRLARNSTDWERWEKAFCSKPGRLYLVDGKRVDPYADDFVVVGGVQNLMDKMEVRKIKRRTRESHLDRAIRGVPVGGTRPFGWLPDRLTLDPVESEWVKRAVNRFLEGRTLNAICRELTAAGVVTPAGNPWSTHALKQMIGNPRLCGWRRLHGELMVDATSGEPIVGQWSPIITPTEWRAVEDKLAARRRHRVDRHGNPTTLIPPAQFTRKHLLTGLVRCGRCMTKLRVSNQKDTLGHLYICSKASGGCGGLGRSGPRVESFVVGAFLEKMSRLDADHEEVIFEQEPELQNLLSKRAKFTAAWNANQMSDELYFEELPKLEASIRRLRAAKESVEAKAAAAGLLNEDTVAEWHRRADDLAWRRSALFGAFHSIIIQPVGTGRRVYDKTSIRLVWRS